MSKKQSQKAENCGIVYSVVIVNLGKSKKLLR